MKQVLFLVIVLLAACNGSNPVAPTFPARPACQTFSTATISFGNRTTSNTTYDIFWDELPVATVAPNQTSATIVAVAGVAHSLSFHVTNTSATACTPSNPVPTLCGTPIYTCSF
jgi:hypothetical protein